MMKAWLKIAASGSLAVIGGAIAYGRYATPMRLPLPQAIEGERRTSARRAGPLSYVVAGRGAPLLLIHSINAAASSYEIKPIFEAFRGERRVYALDLPGFGASDRSARSYSAALYVDAIADMLDEIRADSGEGSVDALALSLSAEFLARLATTQPEAFRTLCLVTPTGFERGASARRGPPGGTREVRGLYATLTVPVWSRGLYNLLVTRPSIRFFLEKTWGSKDIDQGAFDYSYLTSHQPGAQNAPYAFVSGRLFSSDIRAVYDRLGQPVLVLHGTKGDFADFSDIAWTRERSNWRVVPLDSGALPQFERMDEFAQRYREFLATAAP